MFGPRIIRNYFVASVYMLALASAPPVSKKQKIVAAYTIGKENAQELKCAVCMEERENEELFICPGSDSNPHALHCGCLERSEAKDENHKKVCPGCMKSWETQLINIRTRVIEGLLVNCSRFKDVPESVNTTIRRAPDAAELKEKLLQMINNFEELSQIYKQFQDIYKRLLEAYVPVSQIYDSASGEAALEEMISEMDDAFEEFKEDKVRALPEGCQLLVDAPKNIYTRNMIFFMSTPVFFAQLSPKQIIDLGKHLFTFARDDASFREMLAPFFTRQYTYHNSEVLNSSNVFEELLDLTENPTKLERMQDYILEGLREYVVNVKLFPNCCEKLAKIALTNSRIEITEKLYILRELVFFADFTKEMRDRVINYWKERGIKKGDERALEIFHLQDSNIQPKSSSNDEAFEILKKIQREEERYRCRKVLALQLKFYYNMLTCLPNDVFFEEIGRLLLPIRTRLVFSEILPFLPPGELEQRESIVLRRPKGCSDKTYLSSAEISYLYSEVPFGAALDSFFDFVARVIEERTILALEFAAINFGLFFKRDLGNVSNATLFFDGLKKSDLYVVMPLFKKYFVEIPEYEIYIANNMGNIVKNIGLIEDEIFTLQILCALCDTQNEKVHIALCKHFPEYLQEVLEVSDYPLFPYIVLQRICTESAFSENIESAQLREMIKAFATHKEAKAIFGRYMDIFYSCVDARVKREANAIVREFAQSWMSDRAATD